MPFRHKSRAITKNLNGIIKRRLVCVKTCHLKSIWSSQKATSTSRNANAKQLYQIGTRQAKSFGTFFSVFLLPHCFFFFSKSTKQFSNDLQTLKARSPIKIMHFAKPEIKKERAALFLNTATTLCTKHTFNLCQASYKLLKI